MKPEPTEAGVSLRARRVYLSIAVAVSAPGSRGWVLLPPPFRRKRVIARSAPLPARARARGPPHGNIVHRPILRQPAYPNRASSEEIPHRRNPCIGDPGRPPIRRKSRIGRSSSTALRSAIRRRSPEESAVHLPEALRRRDHPAADFQPDGEGLRLTDRERPACRSATPSNRQKSANTAANLLRYQWMFRSPTATPSNRMVPPVGGYSPVSSLISVVLPLPLPPATKTSSPGPERRFQRSEREIILAISAAVAKLNALQSETAQTRAVGGARRAPSRTPSSRESFRPISEIL